MLEKLKLQYLLLGAYTTKLILIALCGSSVTALNTLSDPASPVPARVCPNINVTYYLYTNETQENPTVLDVADPASVACANFTPDGDLKILIHGWTGNISSEVNEMLTSAYFKHSSSYNIIVIDWGKLAYSLVQAVENINLVANCTAQLMRALLPYETQKKINVCNTHLIGHSLGVSVASNITAFFDECLLYRVTGLDPASGVPTELQIRPGISKFTDCLHTNGLFYGSFYPVCDLDTYANDGILQPACPQQQLCSACSHAISVTYFAESINSKIGFYCTVDSFYNYLNGVMLPEFPECQLVGEYVSRGARGTCFFTTNAKSPYAQGEPPACTSKLSPGNTSTACRTEK